MPPLLFWTIITFLSASVPYSPVLARLFVNADLRTVGDGNPGATNVLKAGGKKLGVAAMLLDGFKGAIPIGLAYWLAGLQDWNVVPLGVAALLGHAYSPWLKFQGGKAVAITFGVWAGLTWWVLPTIMGVFLGLFFSVLNRSGWAVLALMLGLLAQLVLMAAPTSWLVLWALNTALLAWKYRADLAHAPGLKPLRRP